MIKALFIGSTVILVTLALASIMFDRAGRFLQNQKLLRGNARPLVTLIASLIWILAVLTLSIWIWALVYLWLGLFETLEPALYFAIVSFTTVGYGDVVLDANWRLLAGMTATNGLLVFGLFTAFLVETIDFGRIKRK